MSVCLAILSLTVIFLLWLCYEANRKIEYLDRFVAALSESIELKKNYLHKEIETSREFLEKQIEKHHHESTESRKKIANLIESFEDRLKIAENDIKAKYLEISYRVDEFSRDPISVEQLDNLIADLKLDIYATIPQKVEEIMKKDEEDRWDRLKKANSIPKKPKAKK